MRIGCSLLIIGLQLIALVRAFQQTRPLQQFKQHRWLRRGWLTIMAAIVVMLGRRTTALLMTYHNPMSSDWLVLLDRFVLPGLISLLLWGGIEGLAYGTRQLLRHPMTGNQS